MVINCHCHIFSLECVPLDFRKRFLLDMRNRHVRWVHGLARRLLFHESKLERYLSLTGLSIRKMAWRLIDEMDEAGVDACVPLMMDMEYCSGYGGGVMPYQQQLEETAAAACEVNEKSGRVRMMPFVAADPRRTDVLNVVTRALDGGVFKGVKIYPVMGYPPGDRRLFPIYEYCAANGVPVTTHCQNAGIPGLKAYRPLAAPDGWIPVLEEFPQLKLDLAHNDRTGSDWQATIWKLIKRYPNVYTDVSYNTEMWTMPGRYFANIKMMLNDAALQDKVLYGTDWYMGRYLWTEASYLRWFTQYARRIPWCATEFTPEEIRRLTEANPKRFLGLN